MKKSIDLISLIAGAVFLLAGVGMLARVALSMLWPLILIAIGGAAIASVVKRKELPQ